MHYPDHRSPWNSLAPDLEKVSRLQPIIQVSQLPLGPDHAICFTPDKKHCRVLLKLNLFLGKPHVSWKDCASLHGSLKHICFVYHDAQCALPALSAFLSKIPNDYLLHYAPHTMINDLNLWLACLTGPNRDAITYAETIP